MPVVHNRAPKSNAERQRAFRERNPGYYGRLHRKRNAAIKARLAEKAAAKEANAAAVTPAPPLALPAPTPVVTLDQLLLFGTPQREPEPVPVAAPRPQEHPAPLPDASRVDHHRR